MSHANAPSEPWYPIVRGGAKPSFYIYNRPDFVNFPLDRVRIHMLAASGKRSR